jgi:23S rRNA (uracil1939-C5)-methyltransferase
VTDFRIHSLGNQGDGVAEGADGPVFAPFTLPGERVRGAVENGRIAAPEIVAPAPERVAPPCPHFGRCGGCALQHADDAFLAAWKTDRVRRALAAVDLHPPIRPIHVSPPGARRRAVLTARRLKAGVALGFHGTSDSPAGDVRSCRVLDPRLEAALPALRALAEAAATRRGALRLTATATETGLDVDLAGGREPDARLLGAVAAAAERADLARVSSNGEVIVMRRRPLVSMGGARVTPPPGGFLQATADGERRLAADALEALGPGARRADLFSGCGTFTLPMARDAAVLAVESDAASLAALTEAHRGASGLRPVTARRRDLFRDPVTAKELSGFDGALFDPPRAGASAQAGELARSSLPRIAAVSCNPESFARDARMIVDGGYRLLWVRPVDQFRWSPHVELVAAFARDQTP